MMLIMIMCCFGRYFNDADEPNITPRVIQYTISDGELNSSAVNVTVAVLPVNDNPTIVMPI